MDNSILKENKIKFVCIGELKESTLELKQDVDVQIGKKGEKKTVKSQQITGKINVDTGSGTVTFFPTFNEIGWDGNVNNRWTMAQAMLNWNPKIKGDSNQPVTKVNIGGTLNYYDGYARDSSKVELKKSYRVESASTRIPIDPETGEEQEGGFSFEGNFYVRNVIVDEDNGEGTLKLYYTNYNSEILPVDCTVDAEDGHYVFETEADDWKPITPNQSRYLKIAYFRVPDENAVTEEKAPVKKFGVKHGHTVDVPTYTKTKEQYVLVSASERPVDPPVVNEDGEVEEVSPSWYNPEAIAKAEKVRDQKLEEMEKNPPAKKSGNNNVANNLRQAKAKPTFGNATKQQSNYVPFDVDSEEDLF